MDTLRLFASSALLIKEQNGYIYPFHCLCFLRYDKDKENSLYRRQRTASGGTGCF